METIHLLPKTQPKLVVIVERWRENFITDHKHRSL